MKVTVYQIHEEKRVNLQQVKTSLHDKARTLGLVLRI